MLDAVLDFLTVNGIEYELIRHRAVITCEESRDVVVVDDCCSCKNLFLRDRKSGAYYLVVLRSDKRADLKLIGEYLGCGRLEMPDEQTLFDVLGVNRGAVSPFALLNVGSKSVRLIVDTDVLGSPRVKFHPNDNTASVVLCASAFLRLLSEMKRTFGRISI